MKKRIFSILLALTMILTFMPAMAFADITYYKASVDANGKVTATGTTDSHDFATAQEAIDSVAVAKIGADFYDSLQHAINAAKDDETITMVSNDTKSFENGSIISISKKIVIDGAGKTVYGKSEWDSDPEGSGTGIHCHGFEIEGSKDVTMKNMKLTQFGDKHYLNKHWFTPIYVKSGFTGKLTLTSVEVSNFNREGIVIYGGTFDISNCTVLGNNDKQPMGTQGDPVNHFQQCIEIRASSGGTIKDTTVKSTVEDNAAAYDQVGIVSWTDAGAVELEDVVVDVKGVGIEPDGNTMTVKGANTTVKATGKALFVEDGGTLNVQAGAYTGNVAVDGNTSSKIQITGGTYSEDVTEYVTTAGSVAAVNNNQRFEIVPATDVYTFKFENGTYGTGTMPDVYVKKQTSSSPYKLPACTFTPATGKVFNGWKIGSTVYAAGDTYYIGTTTTAAITATAQWTNQSSGGGGGAKTFDQVKSEALTEIGTVSASAYDTADRTAIQNAITAATNAVNQADTAAQINSAMATFRATIANYKTTAKKLSDAKTSALAEINAVKPADYAGDATAKAAVEKAISTAKTAVNAATTVDAVNTAMTTFRTEMAKYKTDAQKALEKSKSDAASELDAVKLTSYQEPEKTAVKNAIAEAKTAIDAATTTTAVDTALAAAKETIAKQAKYKSSLPKPKAKAPAKAKKALTAKWKKLSAKNRKKVTGFQVQIATNKTFTKNAKIYTVKGKAKTSKKIKSLKSKKTYYVRVRTYKTTDGVKTVGKWSAVKKIKTK